MASKILIVDDDDDFRGLLSDVFEQAGYEVTAVNNANNALEVFADQPFDAVVTDHNMPEMTGEELIQKIRGNEPDIPIILVSGYLNQDLIQNLKNINTEIFHKPLNVISLLRKTEEKLNTAGK
ncbi:MAG: response regulator [Opitutales bacterium]|nr:response regulator [Opitutales bacterium]